MDSWSTLIGAVAAFVAAIAFLARALTPSLVAWISEDVKGRAAVRRDLDRCHQDRDALARRVAVLEAAHAASVRVEEDSDA